MDVVIGLVLAVASGGIQGAFFLPMKYMKGWEWENGWLVFTLACCVFFPVVLAFVFTPDLPGIYARSGGTVLGTVFLFGLGWGVGVILYGLGAKFLGMAMGIAIVTGINACLGTLFPALFLEAGRIPASAWLVLGLGMVVLLLGVVVMARAGALRDRQLNAGAAHAADVPFAAGLAVCIGGGILCPMMNFGIFFGRPITRAVADLGTVAPYNVGYAQLLPVFLGGSLAQAAYCVYLFRKNRSAANFALAGTASNWFKGVLMALIFVAGMVVYTIAATNYIGDIGPIVGWPLFLSATIIVSNACGVLTGEWKGVDGKARRMMYAGIALLIVAIVLASLSNSFVPPA